ncbi:MAG: hypothetical protein ABI867_23560 [Kofleriaceae bacterium]
MNRWLGVMLVGCVGCALDEEPDLESTEQDLLWDTRAPLWSPNGAGNTSPILVSVCWQTPGWLLEKKVVMDAIRGTWGRASPFTFAENCPFWGWDPRVDVTIVPDGDGGSGGNGRITLNIQPVGAAPMYSVDRLRYLAVHEFGHILAFAHEQDSPLRPDTSCSIDSNGNVQQPWGGVIQLGAWDQRSIMNYCGTGFTSQFDRNSTGYVTPTDIDGVRQLYGTRTSRNRGDFVGTSAADLGIFRQTTGEWWIPGAPTILWGQTGDIPVPGDYDGNGKDDRAIYRPSTGVWWIADGVTPPRALGAASDIPVPADYDGDGRTDMAVYTPSTGMWKLAFASGPTIAIQWGTVGDIPVPGDYDGDGKADLAVYRNGSWFVNVANGMYNTTLGVAGDLPVPADYAGEGKVRPAVYTPATGDWTFAMKPVHHEGRAVFSNSRWHVQWGQLGDVPVPTSHNTRGIANIGVWRPTSPAVFHILGVGSFGWGEPGDIPTSRYSH